MTDIKRALNEIVGHDEELTREINRTAHREYGFDARLVHDRINYRVSVFESLAELALKALDGNAVVVAKVAELEAELEKYHAEECEDLEWQRYCAQQDVRCTECGLRYGERKDYTCPHRGDHAYDADELREALEGGPDGCVAERG